MRYQYLFCAACGLRRTGHDYRCTVCGNLLRRPEARRRASVHELQPLIIARQSAAEQTKQPVAA